MNLKKFQYLKQGECHTESATYMIPNQIGKVITFKTVIDARDEIDEISETDNDKKKSLTIKAKAPPVFCAQLPALRNEIVSLEQKVAYNLLKETEHRDSEKAWKKKYKEYSSKAKEYRAKEKRNRDKYHGTDNEKKKKKYKKKYQKAKKDAKKYEKRAKNLFTIFHAILNTSNPLNKTKTCLTLVILLVNNLIKYLLFSKMLVKQQSLVL